jgi:chemotaxis protein CheD
MSQVLHLNIGELIATNQPVVISTILGSCVSVCLFSRKSIAGGIIHYALCEPPTPHQAQDALRYGSTAINALIREMEKITGEPASQLVAKIAGGTMDRDGASIGADNIAIARRLLTKAKIEIVGESVAGPVGRKILFHIPGGRLQVAKLEKTRASHQSSEREAKQDSWRSGKQEGWRGNKHDTWQYSRLSYTNGNGH